MSIQLKQLRKNDEKKLDRSLKEIFVEEYLSHKNIRKYLKKDANLDLKVYDLFSQLFSDEIEKLRIAYEYFSELTNCDEIFFGRYFIAPIAISSLDSGYVINSFDYPIRLNLKEIFNTMNENRKANEFAEIVCNKFNWSTPFIVVGEVERSTQKLRKGMYSLPHELIVISQGKWDEHALVHEIVHYQFFRFNELNTVLNYSLIYEGATEVITSKILNERIKAYETTAIDLAIIYDELGEKFIDYYFNDFVSLVKIYYKFKQ
ncbi:MAG: hypothetical protein QXI58_02860, partial [Candidatus Micrarchaeia archaeon]